MRYHRRIGPVGATVLVLILAVLFWKITLIVLGVWLVWVGVRRILRAGSHL